MAIARFGRQAKRPHGFCLKMTAVAVLGLCFIFVWSMFSSTSSSVVSQRESFDDIAEPVSTNTKPSNSGTQSKKKQVENHEPSKEDKRVKVESDLDRKDDKRVNGSVALVVEEEHKSGKKDEKEVAKEKREKGKKLPQGVAKKNDEPKQSEAEDSQKEKEEQEEEEVLDGEDGIDIDGEDNGDKEGDSDLAESVDQESEEKLEDGGGESRNRGRKRKIKGPLFDPKAHYIWKLCSTRSKHNYMPCIDIESGTTKLQSYRHTERSCPRASLMCLVPLPHDGYGTPVRWPESKLKILHKNVAHPKLAAFVKKHSWVVESGEYLTFPQNQSEFKGGVLHYLESIEEMVPDIEWGKNIRLVLDIGCTDSSFSASLLDKEVLALSLGLKDDLVDVAQVALERGFPAVVSPLGTRRLPFPSTAFDAIHWWVRLVLAF